MRRIAQEELLPILAQHKLWIETNGREGQRADFSGCDLSGLDLAGANMDGANMAGARGFLPFICVGPIGSRLGITTIFLTQDKVRCGCFNGTLKAFEAQVRKTHKDNPLHLAEYLGLVEYAKQLRAAQPAQGEVTPEPAPPFAEGDEVQLGEDGRRTWPWAPSDTGTVCWCRGGWTRVEFNNCYLSFPDDYVERVAAEEAVTA